MADAEELEGLPLEGGGGGDEPEAGQRGVGGPMVFRQIVPRSVSRVAKLCTGRSPGVCLVAALARARGERAAGGSYEDPMTGGPLTGDALAATVATLPAGFPDLHFDLVSVAPTSDTTAAARWLMRGTNTGPMPAGDLSVLEGQARSAVRGRAV